MDFELVSREQKLIHIFTDRAVLDEPLAAVGGEAPEFIYRRYGG